MGSGSNMERDFVKQILLEQREEVAEVFKERLIEREAMPLAARIVPSGMVKAVIGVRRCGKSVLSHQLLRGKKYGYVNFDDERLTGVMAKDLNSFLAAERR
jgi:predicted AAA+ superfamily ATPase